MNHKELLELENLLIKYKENLRERGYTILAESLTADIIESVGDDINYYVRTGELSRK